jgi:hypothetical protein
VPVSEAALMLQVSRQRVYQLIDAGLVVAHKHNSTWLISQGSIDARISHLAAEEAKYT